MANAPSYYIYKHSWFLPNSFIYFTTTAEPDDTGCIQDMLTNIYDNKRSKIYEKQQISL
jgi:hypothetical protein